MGIAGHVGRQITAPRYEVGVVARFQCLPTAAALIFDVIAVGLLVSDASPIFHPAAAKAVKTEPAKSEPQEVAQAGAEQLGGDADADADIKGAVPK